MEKSPHIIIAVLLLSVVALIRCAPAATVEPTSASVGMVTAKVHRPLKVTVSILPQKYFIERIGDGYVEVNVMVPPGANPATYEPKPDQLKALSEADVYFRIGVPFERAWMGRIASVNSRMRIVSTIEGIERMPMEAHGQREGGQRHDEVENPDPHVWLSPRLVKVQAQTICEALMALDPGHRAAYKANLDAFLADVDALDTDVRRTLAGVKRRKFMVFHPSWGYFARDYGLEMVPIEVGGQEPSAAELADLIALARSEDIKVVLAQPEFSTKAAEIIAQEIGGEVLLTSPLAPDWPDNLRRVAQALAKALDP